MDLSLPICNIQIKLYGCNDNMLLEGLLSQKFDLCPGFIFMAKNVRNNEKNQYTNFLKLFSISCLYNDYCNT